MNIKKPLTGVALTAATILALAACTFGSTEDPAAPATDESSVSAAAEATTPEPEVVEEICQAQTPSTWEVPTWTEGNSCSYAAEMLLLLNQAIYENAPMVSFEDGAGNVTDLFVLAGYDIGAGDSPFMEPVTGTESDACGATTADGFYTRWCPTDGSISVFSDNITAAMAGDQLGAEILVAVDLLYDITDIVLARSGLVAENDVDRGCVAGSVMGTLVTNGVWVNEWSTIGAVYFGETDPADAFSIGFVDNACTFVSLA